MNINKDTIVAIFLLLFCGIMINNSFEIEDPGYQGMKASFWPYCDFVSLVSYVFSNAY